jgi:ABC-2 type transport system permease protein
MLGIAISSLAKSAQSAAAVTNLPYVSLQFMSGIYIPISELPDWMITVGALFPVKWAAQGFRSVFLPDSMMAQEAAGSWELGKTALVLGGWCVVGLALCLLTFRWTNRRAG